MFNKKNNFTDLFKIIATKTIKINKSQNINKLENTTNSINQLDKLYKMRLHMYTIHQLYTKINK